MELKPYYEKQEQLDDYIREAKGLHGQDLAQNKILALQVEIGELLNEVPRVFKHWSKKENNLDKALVEWVDGFHFLLSIGLELRLERISVEPELEREVSLVEMFNQLFYLVGKLHNEPQNVFLYDLIMRLYVTIAFRLGFTEQDIQRSYLEKNEVNHARQDNSY